MKKIFVSLSILCVSASVYAQEPFVSTGSSTAATIYYNGTGNVGIGTSTPGAKLHVYQPNQSTQFILGHPSTSTGGYTSLQLRTSADKAGEGLIQAIKSSGSEWGNIILNKEGGNVGIGGVPGDIKLKVNGDLWVDKSAVVSSNLSGDYKTSWGWHLMVRDDKNTANTFSRLIFTAQSAGLGALTMVQRDNAGLKGDMIFQLRDHAGYFEDRMIIKSDGRVGIGKATPQATLSVNGGISLNYGSALEVNDKTYKKLLTTDWDGGQDYVSFYVAGNKTEDGTAKMFMKSDGKIGIGIKPDFDSDFNLYVTKGIRTEKVQVDLLSSWADFVFAPSYRLRPLSEVEAFIHTNQHLPDVPSAQQLQAAGLDLAQMHQIQMQKIEELTLYLIEIKKENEQMKKEIEALKTVSH